MTDPLPPTSDDSRLPGIVAILLAFASAAFTYLVVTPAYVIDDAFIGFRYARHLWEGQGLVFNPGDYVEGYTSFLWVVMSTLAFPLNLEPITLMQGVSVFAQALTVWFVYRIGRNLGRSGWQALIAPLFLAIHVSFVAFPMTGMDTSFITMLVAWAAALMTGGLQGNMKRSIMFGLVMALIILTRFDGFILAGVFFSGMLFFSGQFLAAIPALLIVAVTLVGYHYWRLDVMGYDYLPNTFKAKVTFGFDRIAKGGVYVLNFISKGNQYLLLAPLVLLALRRPTRSVAVLMWICFFHVLYAISVGGDWMPFFRFMLPIVPLLLILSQELVWTVRDVTLASPALKAPRIALYGLVALMFGFNIATFYQGAYQGRRPTLSNLTEQFARQVTNDLFSAKDAETVGKWIDSSVPQDWYIASEWAGVIPYHAHQKALDIFCLNDSEATKNPFPTSTVGMFMTAEYLAERNPDLVVVVNVLYDSPEAAKAAALDRMEREHVGSEGIQWGVDFYGALDDAPFEYRLETSEIDGRHWAYLLRNDRQPPTD